MKQNLKRGILIVTLFALISSACLFHAQPLLSSRAYQAQMAEIEKFLDDRLLLWVTEGIDDSVLNM